MEEFVDLLTKVVQASYSEGYATRGYECLDTAPFSDIDEAHEEVAEAIKAISLYVMSKIGAK